MSTERIAALRSAVAHATLAPSSHNAQPWRFHLVGETLELYADRTRRLPVVDPNDRELVIGCGAALFYLRLALRHFGWADVVETFPDPTRPDLLARVRVEDPCRPVEQEEALFRAMPRRHSHRRPFDDRPVHGVLLGALAVAVATEGATLDVARTSADRVVLASLVAEGDRRQARDPAFRRELSAWLRPNHSLAHDGMLGASYGFGDVASVVTPFVVRRFDWGSRRGEQDKALAMGAPVLAVVATEDDTPASWLSAGQAVARMLLTATALGLAASFQNQPIEDPALRDAVARALGLVGTPQLLLRLGHVEIEEDADADLDASPRRGVKEVLA